MSLTREQVVSELKKFVDKPIPKILDSYSLKERKVILEFFTVREMETAGGNILVPTGTGDFKKLSDTNLTIRLFSIAKVLKSGTDARYQPGDIVRVRDHDVMVLRNKQREAWDKNPYSKGNVTPIGQQPDQMKNNFESRFGPSIFFLDPLAVTPDPEDAITVCVDDVIVECGIPEVNVLYNGL